MDLLQEISKRFRTEAENLRNKFIGLAYEGTFGLLKEYRDKALELSRISLVALYLRILKVTRKHALLAFLLAFGTVVSAVAAVVVPVTIVLLTPWSAGIKMICLLILGSLYIASTAWLFLTLFSQEHWMKISGVEELLNEVSHPNSQSNGY